MRLQTIQGPKAAFIKTLFEPSEDHHSALSALLEEMQIMRSIANHPSIVGYDLTFIKLKNLEKPS